MIEDDYHLITMLEFLRRWGADESLQDMPMVLDADKSIFTKPDMIKMHRLSRVDGDVKIEGGNGVYIGEYVHIASKTHLNIGGGLLILKAGSAVGSGASIVTGSNDISAPSCSAIHPDATVTKKEIVIGENAVVFVNAVVMASVGDQAVVAAGAVVTKPVPPDEIWAGVPAKKIGVRT